jgi:peptidoglycan biosynthesis protein MviN/MurJ (putative lipid II flippase)
MRTNIVLGLVVTLNMATLFFIQVSVLTTFGASDITDAFIASQTLPMVLLGIFAMSLTRVLVPIMSQLDNKEHIPFLQIILLIVLLISAVAILILLPLASVWTTTIFPGFNEQTTELTIDLLKINLCGLFVNILIIVMNSGYQSLNKFYLVEIIPAVLLIIVLSGFWLMEEPSIKLLAWMLVAKSITQFLLLLPIALTKTNAKPNYLELKKVWVRIKPLIAGASVYRLGPIVDRHLASRSITGTLSIYTLAQNICFAGMQIIDRSIASVIVPTLSLHAKNNNWKAFRKQYLSKSFIVISFTSIGILLFVFIGEALLQFLIGFGQLESENIHLLWTLILFLSGTVICGAAGSIFNSAFFSLGDTKTVTKVGIIGFIISIPLKVFSFLNFGIAGLAVATSLSYLINSIALGYLLEKKLYEQHSK